MQRSNRSAATLFVAVAFLTGCPEDPEELPPGVLEIGVKTAEGIFRPLEGRDTMVVVLGANGLNMVVPSLRSTEIDPRAPDPTVTVTVEDLVMAADIEGARVDMQNDGVGNVLWDLRVPFTTELCCFVCRDALVDASIRDAKGRRFIGSVRVQLERGGCPDPQACCQTADECPDPSLALLCE